MCGILATVNNLLLPEKVFPLLVHRGPDAQTCFQQKNVQLFHYRLSILSIKDGHQPMHYLNRYTIIFNGQIYNHQEVREQFNLECQTTSDTETILHMYHLMGHKMLEHFDGMFVMVIYDKQRNILFFCRDRAGKKPLYLKHENKSIVFASELNAIRAVSPDLKVEEKNIYKYLMFGSFPLQKTPYKNITDVPSGSYGYYDIDNDKLDIKKWWSIKNQYATTDNGSFKEVYNQTKQYLDQAVKRRVLSSDLEVGSFLSGGIDSGLVTAFAKKYNDNLKTFTVVFEGPYNEGPLARLVANKYKTDHTEINIDFSDLDQTIEKIIYQYGEPLFDSSAIPSYYVSKEAKKHLTVILNGDGADELFGGYRRYVPFNKYDFFSSSKPTRRAAALISRIMPPSNQRKNLYNYIFRLLKLASKSGLPLYLSSTVDIFSNYENLLSKDSSSFLMEEKEYVNSILKIHGNGLDKLMNLDFDINLFADLLVKMDIATMAHSLEGRSPFLSKELLSFVPSMNSKYKIDGTNTKVLLRHMAKEYLPPQIVNQPKRGFEIPLKDWVSGKLNDIIRDYLLSVNSYSSSFISNKDKIRILDKRIAIPEEKRAKMLYTLFSLDVWYKKCYLRE